MSTSGIKHTAPPNEAPRGSPVPGQQRMYPNAPPRPVMSPELGLAGRTQLDIEQHMRMFMVEQRAQGGGVQCNRPGGAGRQMMPLYTPAKPQGNFKNTKPRIIAGGRGAPAIATSQTYFNGNRVVTRTELVPVRPPPAGGNPSPPNSNSPSSPQNRGVAAALPRKRTRNGSSPNPYNPQLMDGRLPVQGGRRSLSVDTQIHQMPPPRMATSAVSPRTSHDQRFRPQPVSPSPPPTPPAKDEYWKDVHAAVSPVVRPSPHVDSVLLPPPPESLMAHRSNSLNRQNNPNLRIDIVPPTQSAISPIVGEGEKSGESNKKEKAGKEGKKEKKSKKEAKAEKEKGKKKDGKVLEDVLGIYPAENKQPPGRSAADVFTSKIAAKATFFGRKSEKQNSEGKESKESKEVKESEGSGANNKSAPTKKVGDPDPRDPASAASDKSAHTLPAPTEMNRMYPFNPAAGAFMAELPGTIPASEERAAGKTGGKTKGTKKAVAKRVRDKTGLAKKRDPSKEKDPSKKSRKKLPEGPANDHVYERMPLPGAPPTGPLPDVPPPDGSSTTAPKDAAEAFALPAKHRLSIHIPSASLSLTDRASMLMGSDRASSIMGSADLTYTKELAEWLEALYVSKDATPAPEDQPAEDTSTPSSPHAADTSARERFDASSRASVLNPEGAVRGMFFTPQSMSRARSRAQSRILSTATSDWGARTSFASSMGDAFQYEYDSSIGFTGASLTGPWDSGLGPTGGFEILAEDAEGEAEAEAEDEAGQIKTQRLTYVPLDTFRSGHFSPEFFNPDGYNSDALTEPATPVRRELPAAGENDSSEEEEEEAEEADDVDSAYGEDYLEADDRSSVGPTSALQSQIEAILGKRDSASLDGETDDEYEDVEYLDDLDDDDTDGGITDAELGPVGVLDSEIDAILEETEMAQKVDAQLREGGIKFGIEELDTVSDLPTPLPNSSFNGMASRRTTRSSRMSVEPLPAVAYGAGFANRESTMSVEGLPAVAYSGSGFGGRDSVRSVEALPAVAYTGTGLGIRESIESVEGLPAVAYSGAASGNRESTMSVEALPAVAFTGSASPGARESTNSVENLPAVVFDGKGVGPRESTMSVEGLPAVAYGGSGFGPPPETRMSVEALPAVAYGGSVLGPPPETGMSVEGMPIDAMHQFGVIGGRRASSDYGSIRYSEIAGMRFGDSESVGGDSRRPSLTDEVLPAAAYGGSLGRSNSLRRTIDLGRSNSNGSRRRSSLGLLLTAEALPSTAYQYNPAEEEAKGKRATTYSTYSFMDDSDVREVVGRRTRYLAGRNSELDTDIIFCLKSSELKSPTLPPLPLQYARKET